MHIISRNALTEFSNDHKDAEQQLNAWFKDGSRSTWSNPNELKSDYPSVSIIGNDRVVFNIKGNAYRLIVKMNFKYQKCYIKFVGTHAEYDKIDALTVNHY
jgi:mRNA interferase HigB